MNWLCSIDHHCGGGLRWADLGCAPQAGFLRVTSSARGGEGAAGGEQGAEPSSARGCTQHSEHSGEHSVCSGLAISAKAHSRWIARAYEQTHRFISLFSVPEVSVKGMVSLSVLDREISMIAGPCCHLAIGSALLSSVAARCASQCCPSHPPSLVDRCAARLLLPVVRFARVALSPLSSLLSCPHVVESLPQRHRMLSSRLLVLTPAGSDNRENRDAPRGSDD